MPEVILILVIALIVFGPRKLPELGKSLGQAMAQFRRASEDFKRSWEQEVELEKTRQPESQSAESTYSYSLPEETAPAATEAPAATTEPAPAAAPAPESPRSEHWI
jgi:TatA/E family protein of Tat protein translocase